jgi:hypothetical protein
MGAVPSIILYESTRPSQSSSFKGASSPYRNNNVKSYGPNATVLAQIQRSRKIHHHASVFHTRTRALPFSCSYLSWRFLFRPGRVEMPHGFDDPRQGNFKQRIINASWIANIARADTSSTDDNSSMHTWTSRLDYSSEADGHLLSSNQVPCNSFFIIAITWGPPCIRYSILPLFPLLQCLIRQLNICFLYIHSRLGQSPGILSAFCCDQCPY